jgi:hypothetical protein
MMPVCSQERRFSTRGSMPAALSWFPRANG